MLSFLPHRKYRNLKFYNRTNGKINITAMNWMQWNERFCYTVCSIINLEIPLKTFYSRVRLLLLHSPFSRHIKMTPHITLYLLEFMLSSLYNHLSTPRARKHTHTPLHLSLPIHPPTQPFILYSPIESIVYKVQIVISVWQYPLFILIGLFICMRVTY